ncbi:MAG TPA: MarP family serine protease [Streptosporangiaceae bacterium]|nr:MarP family serine protease [Streptosporangiaceae bacterium]
MPGDLLDLILLALIAAFAVAGYRQGFIIGVLSLAGFVVGVSIGAVIAPSVSRALAKSVPWQAFIAILVVFGVAVLCMLMASGIGVAVRSRLTGRPATIADSLGGAAVNVVAVVIVAWLIGSFVLNAPFPVIASQVNRSAVLSTVDRVMPHSALYLPVFPQLRSLLSNGLYTQVFSAIGAENGLNLAAPDPAVLSSRALGRVEPSIVKIEGIAPSCSLRIEGSGFVISPQHVLTNAHVVAGVTTGPYVYATNGRVYHGRVVLYDPSRDLAVIDVPGLTAAALQFAPQAADGTNAIVAGYPLDHPLTVAAARIGRSVTAYGPNIYQTAVVHRSIYPIRAQIEPGNSGGPLLSLSGRVYGVVFAASTSISDRGYALTAAEVDGDAAAASSATAPVSTGACQGG